MSTQTYILHYAPDNASLVVRLALEELGVRYNTCLVDRRQNAQRTPKYRALNPNGLIPVLETPDGPIFETGAILLWLADLHGGLAPAQSDPARGDCLKWMFFLSNTLHSDLRRLFYPQRYFGDREEDQVRMSTLVQTSIRQHLGILNQRWESDRSGIVLDLYLAPMLRWLALYPNGQDKSWFKLSDFEALFDALKALEDRPSVYAAQIAEGLGSTPFTNPTLPCPPEGFAT
ncbi:MAG: glutathione S-transferase family protein [Roseobacter sp.]